MTNKKNGLNFDEQALKASILWGGFFKCPNTGKILAALKYDDKVLCFCEQLNTGRITHRIDKLMPATAEEYVKQEIES